MLSWAKGSDAHNITSPEVIASQVRITGCATVYSCIHTVTKVNICLRSSFIMQTFVSLRSANNLGIEFVYFNFSFLEYFHKHLLEHVNCPWIHLQVVEVSVYMVKILQSITRSLQIVKDIAIWPNLILVGLICCVFFQQFQPTGLSIYHKFGSHFVILPPRTWRPYMGTSQY